MDFSKEYPHESLKLFMFTTQEKTKEYYLLTQTKTSNLFLYYLLNERGREKAVFKNPFLLDKLSFEERKARMVLIFEKIGRNQIIQSSAKYSSKFKQSYTFEVNSASTNYSNSSIDDLENIDDEFSHPANVKKEEATFWSNHLVSDRSQQNEDTDCYLYDSWE